MAGVWITRAAGAFIALLFLAWIRNPLVNVVSKLGSLIGVVFDRFIKLLEVLFVALKSVIPRLFIPLRRLHGNEASDQSDYFWDFFIGIVFVAVLIILSYADYQLFALRVNPILFNVPVKGSEQALSSILGVYFILTFLVLGFALSDAHGTVPGGSIMFGLVTRERDRKFAQTALTIALIFAVIAAILLGVWTVEKTQFSSDDPWLAAFFQGIFALLALLATALAVPPAIVGGWCLCIILVVIARGVVWLLGMTAWIIVSVLQKLLEFAVALYDLPAGLGAGILNGVAALSDRFRPPNRKLIEFDAEISPISEYLSHRPFRTMPERTDASDVQLVDASSATTGDAATIAARPVEPPMSILSEPAERVQTLADGRTGVTAPGRNSGSTAVNGHERETGGPGIAPAAQPATTGSGMDTRNGKASGASNGAAGEPATRRWFDDLLSDS